MRVSDPWCTCIWGDGMEGTWGVMGSGKMKLDWSWPTRSGIFWVGCHGLICASPGFNVAPFWVRCHGLICASPGFNVVPFWLPLLASLAQFPPLRQASCLKCPPPPPSPPAPGVFDLLNIRSKKDLPVKWDAGQGFYVPGLKNVPCGDLNSMMEVRGGKAVVWTRRGARPPSSCRARSCGALPSELLSASASHTLKSPRPISFPCCSPPRQVLRTGMKHRHVGSHELNIESSRSHSIMTVSCCCTSLDESSFDYGTPRYGEFMDDSIQGRGEGAM